KMAILQENYAEAEQLYQRSLAIYQEIYDRGGLATSLAGLGQVAQPPAARPYFWRALQITTDMQFVPLTLAILCGIGELLLQTGQPERGLELLALALHHPASDHETKARAQQRLAHYQTILPPAAFAAAVQRGAAGQLETTVAAVQAEFSKDEDGKRKDEIKDTAFHPSSFSPRPLIDPLTARELEVLHLIAGGLTNQQIADKLIISVGTAKFYTSQIYSKLDVGSRTQAVARARELGLLS
ncbi:MAG: LuxR C-terminal-related transcriptional regulator, partial [Chloroflexota bacterium]